MDRNDRSAYKPARASKRTSWRLAAAATAVAIAAFGLNGCATQEQTGGATGAGVGALLGAALGSATGRSSSSRRNNTAIGALVGGTAGYFAGSAIGRQLDSADRQRAEAAAQRALAEREAAVQRDLAARNAEIERMRRIELERARSALQKAEAERRAAEARAAAAQRVQANAGPAPTVRWDGQARGSAQAAGPVQVAGQENCQKVNELAVIRGQEVRQVATFCKDPASGRYVRV